LRRGRLAIVVSPLAACSGPTEVEPPELPTGAVFEWIAPDTGLSAGQPPGLFIQGCARYVRGWITITESGASFADSGNFVAPPSSGSTQVTRWRQGWLKWIDAARLEFQWATGSFAADTATVGRSSDGSQAQTITLRRRFSAFGSCAEQAHVVTYTRR